MARKNLAPIQHLVSSADPAIPTPSAGDEYFNSTDVAKKVHNGSTWLYANEFALPFTVGGVLSVGVTGRKQRVYNRSGSPWLIIGADLYISTGPVGSSASFQVNKNGALAFTVSVATGANEANSTPGVIVASGDYLDVDVTAVGSTTPGSDATLTLCMAS